MIKIHFEININENKCMVGIISTKNNYTSCNI